MGDSFVWCDWLSPRAADYLLRSIEGEVAQGFHLDHAVYVEATCAGDDDEPLVTSTSFSIPQLKSRRTPIVWNHARTSSVVAHRLRETAQHLNRQLEHFASTVGQCYRPINYIKLRRLVNDQQIRMHHVKSGVSASDSPVCLLALGITRRTLCFRHYGMSRDEPDVKMHLLHGCLNTLAPSVLNNGCSYAVRLGAQVPLTAQTQVLLEFRSIERLRQIDASRTWPR